MIPRYLNVRYVVNENGAYRTLINQTVEPLDCIPAEGDEVILESDCLEGCMSYCVEHHSHLLDSRGQKKSLLVYLEPRYKFNGNILDENDPNFEIIQKFE